MSRYPTYIVPHMTGPSTSMKFRMRCSAESALGRWYFEVPSWGFGGSHSKAKDLLRAVIARHPDNQTALSFLADVLIDEGKKDEAMALLRRVIAAPVDPDWIPEHDDYVAKATARLTNLTKH